MGPNSSSAFSLSGRTCGTGSEALLEAHLAGPQKASGDQVLSRLRSSGIRMVPVASSSGTRPADESWRWQPPARLSRGSVLSARVTISEHTDGRPSRKKEKCEQAATLAQRCWQARTCSPSTTYWFHKGSRRSCLLQLSCVGLLGSSFSRQV